MGNNVMRRTLVILGGQAVAVDVLRAWAASATTVIAADGGANRLAVERPADAVVGDGDSIDGHLRDHLVADDDQETTDCEKALAAAEALGEKSITMIGVEGDRLDHVLATISACADSSLEIRLVLELGFGYIVRPGSQRSFRCEPGATVSLLPISQMVASMAGTAWPVEPRSFAPGGFKSISNKAAGNSVEIVVNEGVGLLFVHRTTDNPVWD